MAYVYKITNIKNGKMYIGKTELTIKERFQQHCRDSKKIEKNNRPLYKAMNKYGVESFVVEELEETNFPEEREKYWIEFYNTFKNGYNATIGGDGKRYIDYDLVVNTYKEIQNASKTAEKLGISHDTVLKILKNKKISALSSAEVILSQYGKITNMYTLNDEYIQSFPSVNA